MDRSFSSQSICFIGAGSIAESIVRGLLEQKKTQPQQVSIVNRQNVERLAELQRRYGVQISDSELSRQKLIQTSDILIIAMKPKDAPAALKEIAHLIHEHQLVISVVAGLSITAIERLLSSSAPIARSMPNTSSAIGIGATGISFSKRITLFQEQLAMDIFRSIGIVCPVAESELDIVTGVSGSGPAYVYYMMEAMIDAGVNGGLAEATARELTLQTILGAAQMAIKTKESPADLRRKVTSPGGTTQAAIEVLNECDFPGMINRTILRAAERARELGEAIDSN